MHIWFRQYAQQMGMQNVRGILPKQIDIAINTSITDKVKEVIAENVSAASGSNAKIGQVNSLIPLYRVEDFSLKGDNPFMKVLDEYKYIGKMCNKDNNGDAFSDIIVPDYLYIVSFMLSYTFDNNITPYFPVRIVDGMELANTMQDKFLKNTIKSPIIVIHSSDVFELYIDKFIKDSENIYHLEHNLLPDTLRMTYINKPRKVEYNPEGESIDSDLPEFMHVDILKHAVDLYRSSVSENTTAGQQATGREQAAQVRPNA